MVESAQFGYSCFNSRTCEGATETSQKAFATSLVSIHAPVKVRRIATV